jgi:Raf kinase inhibitor-like YbhB/YbcL family protein
MTFTLTCHSFVNGETIPKEFTGEGGNQSPALEWASPPEGTKELALVCEDPDAPRAEPWVHWLLYKIPGNVRKLPQGIPPTERIQLPPGALQGLNSFGNIGYGGPMPPPGHGSHRYYFRLLALDTELPAEAGLSKDELLAAVEGHVLGTAELMGRYERAQVKGNLKLVA